jgi:hypothetical protein
MRRLQSETPKRSAAWEMWAAMILSKFCSTYCKGDRKLYNQMHLEPAYTATKSNPIFAIFRVPPHPPHIL